MAKNTSNPYSLLHIVWKYLGYYIRAETKYDIHSPFAFDFVSNVVNKAHSFSSKKIEKQRKNLINSKQTIDFIDFGKNGASFRKKISDVAKGALKSRKYAQLLGQIVKHYKPSQVLELGTSLGITTAYLSYQDTPFTTLEGDPTILKYAKNIWSKLGIDSITDIVGNFDTTLDSLKETHYDLIFIDGNHKLQPTLRYFEYLKKKASSHTLFIFDDIHYSKDMEVAWKKIQSSYDVRVTIDLFFLGIVHCDPALSKQDYVIRY